MKIIRTLCAAMALAFHRVEFFNIAEGTHAGAITKLTDAAIATRFLRVKFGSDANHIAVAGVGTADAAIGICTDEASAAEQERNVNLLGSARETQKGVASAAIAAGDFITGAASGKYQTLTGIAAATYWVEGRALTAGVADGLIEFDPCLPYQVTVT